MIDYRNVLRFNVMIFMALLMTALLTGCHLLSETTRAVGQIGERYYSPCVIYKKHGVIEGRDAYITDVVEYSSKSIMGPACFCGPDHTNDRLYNIVGEREMTVAIDGNNLILISDDVNGAALGWNDNDCGNGLPHCVISHDMGAREIYYRKWYYGISKGLYLISIPFDIVANITIVPGIIVAVASHE